MNKFIFFFIILLSLSSINANNIEVEDIQSDGYLIGDNIRVRESYSIDSRVMGYLKIGSYVKCIAITKNKYSVSSDLDYWYKCATLGSTGWIYGKYISKDKFDKQKYLNTLPTVKHDSKIYNSLINTKWSTCNGNEPIECYTTVFNDKTIVTSGMEGTFTYLIESINESGSHIRIIGKLVMSESFLLQNPNETIKYTISRKNDKTIKVNDYLQYKI
jgi:hypothetical protein